MENNPEIRENTETDYEEGDTEPLSNCPFFHLILTKSQVTSLYYLSVPAKFHRSLPNNVFKVELIVRRKTWPLICARSDSKFIRFTCGWKVFVVDNNLKAGDGCVFELIEVENETARFKVQILRGDIPKEFLDKLESTGVSSANPITL